MANGKSLYSREIINDSTQSTKTTYSSQHIKELVDDAQGKVSSSSGNAIQEKTDGLYVQAPTNKNTLDKLSVDSDGDLNYDNNKVMDTSILKEFQANHLYVKDEMIINGNSIYTRKSTGTSGSTFDNNEKGNWTLRTQLKVENNATRIRCYTDTFSITASTWTYIANTYIDGDSSLKDSSGRFVAPISGMYYMHISPLKCSTSTATSVGIVKNRTDSNNSWAAIQTRTGQVTAAATAIIWLNQDEYLYPLMNTGASATISSQNAGISYIEFGLLNAASELINKSHLWEVGTEYYFGDNLYGQRFTGTIESCTLGTPIDINTGVMTPTQIIDYHGSIAYPQFKDSIPGFYLNTTDNVYSGAEVWLFTRTGTGITLHVIPGVTGTNITYDYWVKYLK